VATWDDVRRVATALPESVERAGEQVQWWVGGRLFAWERPLRPKDLAELGDAAPEGPVLGVRVADEGVKRALVAAEPDVYFTTSHFDGNAAVLVRLDAIDPTDLAELVTEGWLLRAPKKVAAAYLAANG
jgi:hypothetical protein